MLVPVICQKSKPPTPGDGYKWKKFDSADQFEWFHDTPNDDVDWNDCVLQLNITGVCVKVLDPVKLLLALNDAYNDDADDVVK